ncbi:MAG: hypothetical protein JWN14_4003 [Chthonomonadales bacterium]|nr:hypothetical protein [Chthonomonadales bacterium]
MRNTRTRFPLLAAAACILLGLGSALPSHAQAFDVFAGYDLFQTAPGTSFLGTPLIGVPLGHYNFGGVIGNQNVGLTDTIVHRLNNAGPSVLGGTVATPLQMNALSMVTAVPTTFGGALPLNTYYVFLDPTTPSVGSMAITYGSATSGTFVSSLNVNFDIGTAPNDPSSSVFSSSVVLNSSGPVAWSDISPPGAVLIPGVNLNLNGSTINNDFWPVPFSEDSSGAAHHIVTTALATPEPGSVALLTASGVFGISLLRRRAR